MHSDYTMLATEKEPIVYLEHSKVVLKDSRLVAYKDDGKIETIPPISTCLLLLGAGTSITQSAAIYCAQNNLFLCFARGGSYIHSVWQGGRWPAPEKLVQQCLLHSNEKDRLRIAKKLIYLKLKKEKFSDDVFENLEKINTVNKLLSFEAVQAKRTYKVLSQEFLENEDECSKFVRDKNSHKGENGNLTLLNNALYSYCTAIIIQFGFSPSVGFVHGKTRRGGLSFDLADVFKYELTIKPSFANKKIKTKDLIVNFSLSLKHNRYRIVKEMFHILKYINGEINDKIVEDILDEYNRL